MSIKTWREREFDAIGFVAVSPASNVIHMQAEINELRAALAARDAKHLAGLEAIAMHVEALESKVAAQRVVLEQALEFAKLIAEHYPTISKPIITAIQEQLK